MSATTVKLESKLLERIAHFKPRQQTLASFVREAVENDLRRRRLKAGAEEYRAFVEQNQLEQTDLEVWEEADLSQPPKRRRR